MVLRRRIPPQELLPKGATWKSLEPEATEPGASPSIHEAQTTFAGAVIRVLHIATDRYSWSLLPAEREYTGHHSRMLTRRLPEGATIALSLGTRSRDKAKGFRFRGDEVQRFSKEVGGVRLDPNSIHVALLQDVSEKVDAIEEVLTVAEGKLLASARRASGSMRARAALCELGDGSLLLSTTTFDSDEATSQVLLDAGCKTVIALERGSKHAAFVHIADTEDKIESADDYETTLLVGTRTATPAPASP